MNVTTYSLMRFRFLVNNGQQSMKKQ